VLSKHHDIAGTYYPLRRQGDYLIRAFSTYSIEGATRAELQERLDKLSFDNPTLQIGSLTRA